MATATVTADSNDQHVYRSAGTYAGVASDVNHYSDAGSTFSVERSLYGGPQYYVYCGLIRFDTSSQIASGSTINSASFKFMPSVLNNTDTLNLTGEFYVWDGVSASDWTKTAVVTAFSTALSGLTVNSTKTVALTLSAGNISTTGFTYMRLHISNRASDAAPTGTNRAYIYQSSQANPPQLVIDYTPPVIVATDLVGAVAI